MATIRRNKSILAVQMLIAKTDWLSGHQYWENGTVVWRTAGESLSPEAADLSRAQRTLNKLLNYPNAARTVLGNPELWLEKRREALELAKLFHKLPPASILNLPLPSATVCTQICPMLIAEAACLNDLTPSPCRSFISAGSLSLAPLSAMMSDDSLPVEGRALAALTLGALERTIDAASSTSRVSLSAPIDRAYTWGRAHGLPRDAALVSRLLIDQDGIHLADKYSKTAQTSSAFALSPMSLLKLLAEGAQPSIIGPLCEAAIACEPIAQTLLRYRRELSEMAKHKRQATEHQIAAEALRSNRLEAVNRIAHYVQAYAASTGDPRVVRLISTFVLRALKFADETYNRSESIDLFMESIDIALNAGLKLRVELQGPFFELLAERHDFLWNTPDLPQGDLNNCEIRRIRSWLATGFNQQIEPARALLAECRDHATAADCIELNIHRTRTLNRWRDPKMFRLAVDIARYFGLQRHDWPMQAIFRVMDMFKTAREVQQHLSPIVHCVERYPEQMRQWILGALMDEIGLTRREVSNWPRISSYVSLIIRCIDPENGSCYLLDPLISLAVKLDERAPKQAKPIVTWVVDTLCGQTLSFERYQELAHSVRIATELALPLAATNEGGMKAIFHTALQHKFRHHVAHIKIGLDLIKDLPTLKRSLAQLFPSQPQRIVELLARMSATTKLGIDVSALMSILEPQHISEDGRRAQYPILLQTNNDWWRLHQIAPYAIVTANTSIHAAWLSKGPQDLPSNVRRILDRPNRLAHELDHIKGQLLANPERTDLAARATKLTAIIEDHASLIKEMRTEIIERMQHAAALAHIATLEERVVACYRTRLELLTGPLASELSFTSDLINATLLTVDVAHNRRLLLTLIREHISGNTTWRENHPANAAFLADLAARGTDISVWLSEYPRRYPSPAIPGKWIHFNLESDPLHILQMGNYFDTCLSFGQMNSFSTVANAVELNKRVIYARDSYGRVVGRKLIGINEVGELLGFHTYCSLTDSAANKALHELFHRYATKFAAKCGLQTSDRGAVPILFAEDWYDDGSISWSTETEPHHHASNHDD